MKPIMLLYTALKVFFNCTICKIVLENRVELIIIGNVTKAIIPAVGLAHCILKHEGIPCGACAHGKKDKNEHL